MSERGALAQLQAACASCPDLIVEQGDAGRGATVRRRHDGRKVAGFRLNAGQAGVRSACAALRRLGWPVKAPR